LELSSRSWFRTGFIIEIVTPLLTFLGEGSKKRLFGKAVYLLLSLLLSISGSKLTLFSGVARPFTESSSEDVSTVSALLSIWGITWKATVALTAD
jgi:hypothetical protein